MIQTIDVIDNQWWCWLVTLFVLLNRKISIWVNICRVNKSTVVIESWWIGQRKYYYSRRRTLQMLQCVNQTHRPDVLVPVHPSNNNHILYIVISVHLKRTESFRIKFRFYHIIIKLTWFLVQAHLLSVTHICNVDNFWKRYFAYLLRKYFIVLFWCKNSFVF